APCATFSLRNFAINDNLFFIEPLCTPTMFHKKLIIHYIFSISTLSYLQAQIMHVIINTGKNKMNHTLVIQSIGLTVLLVLGQTESAWALQSHGAPEGIYVHQMSHLLFMGALAYLYWHTRRSPVLV